MLAEITSLGLFHLLKRVPLHKSAVSNKTTVEEGRERKIFHEWSLLPKARTRERAANLTTSLCDIDCTVAIVSRRISGQGQTG